MERENRKVLISVKVSTLLLILIGIIAVVVLANVVKNKLENNAEIANANTNIESQENTDIDETEQEETETVPESRDEVRTIKAEVSSRSSEPRTEENEIAENILQGNVGRININAIENSIQEEIENVYISIDEVTISKDMDLRVRTGLSRDDFITLIAGVKEDKANFFEENAGLIYDICEEYQINEVFFCGLIAGESGWRIADNHRRTHNYISLMSHSGLIKFASVEEGLRKAAEALHKNYLTEGGRFYNGPTLAGVKTRFCPASSTWVNLIYGNMKLIVK